MSAMVDFDIVGSYNNQRITSLDGERSVNMFEYIDALAKKPKSLQPTSGIANSNLNFAGAIGGFRAQFVFNNIVYNVIGNRVYSVNSALAVSLLGNINTASGYVAITANTTQVLFVDGLNGWIWTPSNSTFLQITDTSFPTRPLDATYIDGFFLVINGQTNTFELSELNNGFIWGKGESIFTASSVTNELTLAAGTANFATGVDFTLSVSDTDAIVFTGSSATDQLTLAAATPNFPTGAPLKFAVVSPETAIFTANSGTDQLTLAAASTNFPTGAPVKVSTTGTLPAPLDDTTTYYVINVSPTVLKLATTYANAIANTAINLTTNGTPTNKIIALGDLPAPLTTTATYYAINVSPTVIKVAATKDDALNNISIDLTTNGSPTNEIVGKGQLPDPLKIDETYYAIKTGANTIKVAATYNDALTGIFITLTTDGSPTLTITNNGQLQQGAITSHPGTIVACATLHRRVFLFSQFYTEVWENAGIGTNLPLRRNNSLLIEYGTPAIGSVAVGFDRMFFLSQDRDGLGSVMEVVGAQAIPVSNRALDSQLAVYFANPLQGVADCRSFLIKENGLIFYRMNFTQANHTFILNVSLSQPGDQKNLLWHEEETLAGNRHPAQTHVFFNGTNYVGDYSSPKLYILSSSIYTNDGQPIRRMRIWRPWVPPGYQRIRVDRLQMDLLQGAKQQYAAMGPWFDSSDPPYVFLAVSKDGGQTYGYEVKAPMGKLGERSYRTLWRKIGTFPRGQAFVGKIEFFSPIPFVILGAAWAMEVLPE